MSEEITDELESATPDTNTEEEIEEKVVDSRIDVAEKKEIRMVWKMPPRDYDDAIKMAEMFAQEKKLKKKTPQFVSKYMFMESLKRCRKDGNI